MRYGRRGENVTVISSSLDDYVRAVQAEGAFDLLPVVTADLSDTWVFGGASDPIKARDQALAERVGRVVVVMLMVVLMVLMGMGMLIR